MQQKRTWEETLPSLLWPADNDDDDKENAAKMGKNIVIIIQVCKNCHGPVQTPFQNTQNETTAQNNGSSYFSKIG